MHGHIAHTLFCSVSGINMHYVNTLYKNLGVQKATRVEFWHRHTSLERINHSNKFGWSLPTYLSICQSRRGASTMNLHLFEVVLLIHANETLHKGDWVKFEREKKSPQ